MYSVELIEKVIKQHFADDLDDGGMKAMRLTNNSIRYNDLFAFAIDLLRTFDNVTKEELESLI